VAPQQTVSIGTPFIRPLYDTRAVEKTLGDVAKKLNVEYRAATVKDEWAGVAGTPAAKPLSPLPALSAPPSFRADDLVFQAYPSLQFGDGSTPAVPWLHELPDPASSAIWGLPVEIDPQTAARYGIATGDNVRVESPHAGIEAPAYVHPGAVPGVLSMAIGGGRGPNPLTLLDGAPFTRVRVARVGPSRSFIQFAAPDREEITRR
jgi:Molydopterin dinucleotide binding domain